MRAYVRAAHSRASTVMTHGIGFLKVEDQIQLAHVSEIPIEDFDVSMHDLECDELIVRIGDGSDEEERGVATINDFGI